MEIIRVPIGELTPDPDNAKDHPKWQIEQIKNSIEQFGNLDPIGIWGDDKWENMSGREAVLIND